MGYGFPFTEYRPKGVRKLPMVYGTWYTFSNLVTKSLEVHGQQVNPRKKISSMTKLFRPYLVVLRNQEFQGSTTIVMTGHLI